MAHGVRCIHDASPCANNSVPRLQAQGANDTEEIHVCALLLIRDIANAVQDRHCPDRCHVQSQFDLWQCRVYLPQCVVHPDAKGTLLYAPMFQLQADSHRHQMLSPLFLRRGSSV